jgi:hypothetical protein
MAEDGELKGDLVEQARDDWLDLLGAVAVVKIVEGGEGRLALLRRAGPLVVDLVREGRLVCGEPSAEVIGGFDTWRVEADEAADVIDEYVRRSLAGEQAVVPGEPCSFASPEQVRAG